MHSQKICAPGQCQLQGCQSEALQPCSSQPESSHHVAPPQKSFAEEKGHVDGNAAMQDKSCMAMGTIHRRHGASASLTFARSRLMFPSPCSNTWVFQPTSKVGICRKEQVATQKLQQPASNPGCRRPGLNWLLASSGCNEACRRQ